MPKLTPITLDENTTVFIECTEDTELTFNASTESYPNVKEQPIDKAFPDGDGLLNRISKSSNAIQETIRSYTSFALNAFKGMSIADVDKVILKFGIEIGGEAGIPYITKGTAKSILNIEVHCSFSKNLD
jgi:hypothetical protein